MQRVESVGAARRPVPMSWIYLAAFVIHAPLLLMKLPLKSYDTNFHIFFASHYVKSLVRSLEHEMVCGVFADHLSALAAAMAGADLAHYRARHGLHDRAVRSHPAFGARGLPILHNCGLSRRAAAFAALASVLLGSECFLVYSAGQLSTTFAAPLYLNALPYLYEWVRRGNWRSFLKGATLSVAAAAAHHATLLFGSFLFALPVLALAFFDREDGEKVSASAFWFRAIAAALLVGVAIAVVLLPFWIALINYPVTQVPIPHPSRANYILSPEWGLNYFVIPYGALILALPFIFGKVLSRDDCAPSCLASGWHSCWAWVEPLQSPNCS